MFIFSIFPPDHDVVRKTFYKSFYTMLRKLYKSLVFGRFL